MTTKRCIHCQSVKPLAAFYRVSSRVEKYSGACKDCRRAYALEMYRRKGAPRDRLMRALGVGRP